MARGIGNGLDLRNQRIQNVASGSAPTDAVNLAQLQAALAGLSWHGAVRAASTGPITVANPGATLDGVTLAVGNRVLLKNQAAGSENGVYVFNGSSSPLTRASDGTQGSLNAGAAFYVDEGSTQADSAWTLATDDPITVGTTSLAFNRFGAGTPYTAGTGLTLDVNNKFSIDTSMVARKAAANIGDGSSTTITHAHNLGTLDVTAQLVIVATGETFDTDTVRTTTNAVAYTFATAPASGQYRSVVTG